MLSLSLRTGLQPSRAKSRMASSDSPPAPRMRSGVWWIPVLPPHVANLKQQFPGAKLRPSLAQKLGIQMSTATGQPFANLGEFEVPFHTQEGHPYTTTFQNAEVSMPILSTGRMADSGCTSTFKKDGGTIHHEPSNAVSHFIRCHGVYFVNMVVDPELLNTGAPFQRLGAA